MVYRDMTFCPFHEQCKDGKTCHRAMTEEVMKKASERGLPISQFMDKPECFVKKGESDE